MGEIEERFKELRAKNRKAFIIYLPFGYPNLSLFRDILLALEDTEIDFLEIGIPFSDPIADGIILQEASHIAIREGANTPRLFSLLSELKKELTKPKIIMSYFNPIYHFGEAHFLKKCKEIGIEGIMVVDLPLEEASSLVGRAHLLDIDTIFFVTPTTSLSRVKRIVKITTGFIYYISVTGITGPRHLSLTNIAEDINKIKKITSLPICVGFGIHTNQQVKALSSISDGVIVGSIVAKFIKDNHKRRNFIVLLKKFIHELYV